MKSISSQYDIASELRAAVLRFLILLFLGACLPFAIAYLATGRYDLLPYLLVPYVLPFLGMYLALRKSHSYRINILFVAYVFVTAGYLKMLAEPLYLVDLFLLPVYIGMAFLVLHYRHALVAVLCLALLFGGAAAIVHYYRPFELIYVNANITSVVVGYLCSVAAFFTLFYTFGKQYQQGSDSLGSALLALQKVNDDNKLMISVISHDFRNHLGRVLMQVELGRDSQDVTDRQQAFDAVEASMMNLSDLLTEVQKVREMFNDAGDSEKTAVPLREIMTKLAMVFRHQMFIKQIALDTSACEDLSVIVRPDVFIHIILGNLLGNALKFSPQGAAITVSATQSAGKVVLRLSNFATADQAANLRQLESGSERVKSMPGTANEAGNGLGLGIVRRFCHLHGIDFGLDVKPAKDGLLEVSAVLALA